MATKAKEKTTAGAKPAPKKAAAKPAPKKAAKPAPKEAQAAPKPKKEKVKKEKKIKYRNKPVKITTGIAVGLHAGHKISKRKLKEKPVNRRRIGKRTKAVRELIREVCGFAPYERRILELVRVGLDKRALKVAKRKIGTHRRAVKKREEMTNVVAAQRLAAARAAEAKEKKKAEKAEAEKAH
jgi:large subunit ribosomal protein L36e